MPPNDIVTAVTRVLEARPEVLEAYLFGSTARNEAQDHSDIDVAVYVDQLASSSFGYDAELLSELMKALGTNRVDLVVLNQASPLLYHRVLRDGVRLFARDLRATTRRSGQALSRYCDFAVHLAKIDALHAERIRRGDFGREPG